jgi:hypothetical protein
VPEIKYSFLKLDELINKPKDSTCGRRPVYHYYSITLKFHHRLDVIAVVSEVGEVVAISTKTNRTVSEARFSILRLLTEGFRLPNGNSPWLIARTHQSGSPYGENRPRHMKATVVTLSLHSKG